MATPTPLSYSAAVSPILAGRWSGWSAPVTARTNGNWTQQSKPQAVRRGDYVYLGWIANNGDVGVTKHSLLTGLSTHFVLVPGFQYNGHANSTVTFLQDGRVVCVYSKHSDSVGVRYKISTNPEDISSFGSEQVLTVTTTGEGTSYNVVFYLSSTGKYYVVYRAGDFTQKMRATADFVTWDAERTVIAGQGGHRPYIALRSDGDSRVDWLYTTGHPNERDNSIYHVSMEIEGGSEVWRTTSGTQITAPATPTNGQIVYAFDGYDGWCWDVIRRGSEIYGLWSKYVTTGTDHRMMLARWNGASWTNEQVAALGGDVDDQLWSDGQAAFDPIDQSIIYLCGAVSGVHELQAFKINSSATSKLGDITSGSTNNNFSPVPVVWADKRAVVAWLNGPQSSYLNFATNIKIAGRF